VRTVSRSYEPGDEAQINRLYLSLTGRDRTPDEYAWEWLHTWNGQGSINLVFDLEREEGDQLIAQYSLIPTPLSVWGRPALAGKTENCMSHPVCRGTGLYSAHERECFEKEKERYSFFFTTAGTVTGGAVGRVRSKLGYVAFDDWANYRLWLRTGALRRDIGQILAAKVPGAGRWAQALGAALAEALQAYSRLRRPRRCRYRFAAHAAGSEPLEEIAALWERNRAHYGVTVDRRADYLRWRIDEDPHVRHEYLTMRDEGGLLGYAVVFTQDDDLHVVDLLVDGARADLARELLGVVIRRGADLGLARVKCLTLSRSQLLPGWLRGAGFIDFASFSRGNPLKKVPPRQFYLYIPEELRDDSSVTDNAGWYITSLVMEGLPRT
jgi:hypothetical protein